MQIANVMKRSYLWPFQLSIHFVYFSLGSVGRQEIIIIVTG